MKKNNENFLYVGIVVLLLLIDQLSKQAMRNLANGVIGYSMKIFGDFFRLTYVENHGGIFGVFQGHIKAFTCLLYTSPSPRDVEESRMPSSA